MKKYLPAALALVSTLGVLAPCRAGAAPAPAVQERSVRGDSSDGPAPQEGARFMQWLRGQPNRKDLCQSCRNTHRVCCVDADGHFLGCADPAAGQTCSDF